MAACGSRLGGLFTSPSLHHCHASTSMNNIREHLKRVWFVDCTGFQLIKLNYKSDFGILGAG